MAITSHFHRMEAELSRSRYPRDVFELRVEAVHHEDRWRIGFRSNACQIEEALYLRRDWVYGEESVYRLASYIEQLVGRTLMSLVESCRDPAAAARALLPCFIAEIHRRMEEMERTGRERYQIDRMANMPPIHMGMDFGAPVEDPKARKKATDLLMQNLDADQLKEYKRDKRFTVKAKDGKKYVISTARSFNVKGEDGTTYCGQLVDTPIEDQMLAQKLLLEHEPEKFFKNANRSRSATTGASLRAMVQTGLNAQLDALVQSFYR